MTAADDAAVLAVLEAVANLTVYDGHVTDSDGVAKTVGAPLPYVVFHRFSDDDSVGDSLGGSTGSHLCEWQITFVGETPEQARLVGERAAAVLNRQRIGGRFVRRTEDRLPVGRDDVWTRPDGGPLFFGADRYVAGAQ